MSDDPTIRTRGYRIRRAIRLTLILFGYAVAYSSATMDDKPLWGLAGTIFLIACIVSAIDAA